ncbi:cytochrome P450 6a2-like [Anoplophora glabripennis]|uniref:cytochrome P450 6a2-like n=1 Tax=Anoplophora glabripennis TaxID=217634 RepID=UPI000C78E2E4|nr:cytochrome P450 6a2-like [Anoplophora glabripennis]XP_023310270.1 cytochrome P450 6a2-like [Anoplophora glabripennis]XP_023310271.1 cytochrome P450 6a2-like [Anoplophora glabripennis]
MVLFTNSIAYDALVFFVTLTVVVYAYFKWKYQYWKRKGLPYFVPKIPFGNFPNPLTSQLSMGEHIALLYKEAKARGWKGCGLYTMAVPIYMVLDMDLVKNIMTKDFNNFMDRGIYFNEKADPISAHLFAITGMKWKNLRAKLTPTFTSGKMKMMFQTMADCGVILEKYIKDEVAGKQVVDIKDILGRFSTDIIGSCAFGLDCNSFEQPNSPFRVYGKNVLETSTLELIKEAFCISFPKAARALSLRVFRKQACDFYTSVVHDTISYREKNSVKRNDFMQLLLEMKAKDDNATENGNTLTMPEIIAQSFVFFIAGFETSSTTMTFALFELARNTAVQDKVREEIRTVLAKHDNKVTYDSMNELVYMKQVIDETLRMYPPVPLLTRESAEDYKIPGQDFILEKGTIVFIPASGIHYDEDHYKNPKVFDPDRFSVENKKARHPYAHLPFGEGPRVCIGERFGILQSKVGLTSILKDFKVTLSEKTKLPLKMNPYEKITSPIGGIWLKIEKV